MSWIVWAILGAIATAVTAILSKVGMEKVDSTLALAIQSVITVVLTWSIVGFGGQATRLLDIPAKAWPFLLGAGVVTTLAYLCYFRALKMGDSSQVAPIDRLSLVFTIAMASFFLREKLSPIAIAGAAMMALGAVMIAASPGGK